MAISRRIRGILSSPSLLYKLKTLTLEQQRRDYTAGTVMGIGQAEGPNDTTWKIVDSKTLRIKSESIPPSALRVLNTLQTKGYAAYLVGGCVRDLILKRAPKDFDVITTANLKQIKKHFHRCIIIGRRFPICQVHILGNVVEVSSFNTVAKHGVDQKAIILPKLSKKYNEKDLTCWKNCMTRDFSINCLFFDPFKCKIYDYVDALKDLKSYTVRTVIPPHLSFKEDCARILRGMRIAARLGFQFSKKTEAAILDLSSSIHSLCKDRLMMEMNFMMAHGAAASSINLLQKFKLLKSLFPAHAAYLSAQNKKLSSQQSVMLMKLLVNADNLLRADLPCCCNLWLGLLAFHLALVDNPQDALVIWTFSSILYHGTWNEAVEFAKGSSNDLDQFVPEIAQSSTAMPDDILFRKTSWFVSLAKSAVKVLTDTEVLQQSLAKYGSSSRCSVFVPQKTGKKVCELFDVMNVHGDHGGKRAERCLINYELLKKGDLNETRFVLGKIIMDTMKGKPISEPDQSSPAAERENRVFDYPDCFRDPAP